MRTIARPGRLSALLLLLLPLSAHADDDRPSIGDGYKHSSNVLLSTVEASSTTAADITLKASTDGTTEATSGEGSSKQASAATTLRFAKLYRDQLAKEFAQGGGEKAVVLATLLRVPRAEIGSFLCTAQQHFEELYPSDTVPTEVVLERLAKLRAR